MESRFSDFLDPSGMVIVLRESQFIKASFPMLTTVLKKTIVIPSFKLFYVPLTRKRILRYYPRLMIFHEKNYSNQEIEMRFDSHP